MYQLYVEKWYELRIWFMFSKNKTKKHCTRPVLTLSVNHVNNPLQWCHNEHDGISNHQCPDCLHHHLFRHRSKKISKLCVTGFCEGNSPVTGEFPTQRASNVKNVSIWWRHHAGHCLPLVRNLITFIIPVVWEMLQNETQKMCFLFFSNQHVLG